MDRGRIVLGLALVAVGILYLLDRAGAIEAGQIIRDWWPVIIIAMGVGQALERRRFLGPGLVIAAGTVLLLDTTDAVTGSVWGVVWPVLLIVLGVAVVVRGEPLMRHPHRHEHDRGRWDARGDAPGP